MIKDSKKTTSKVISACLMFSALIFFLVPSSFAIKTNTDDKTSNHIQKSALDLVVPTKDRILRDGYPTNESGQTYGPNMENHMSVEPDLILAEGENGVLGYIYQPEGISSPSELDEYIRTSEKSTSIYLHDGKTIIGTFNFN